MEMLFYEYTETHRDKTTPVACLRAYVLEQVAYKN
jgi:hypothetical protein